MCFTVRYVAGPFLFLFVLMIMLTWNCRGAQGKDFRRALKNISEKKK